MNEYVLTIKKLCTHDGVWIPSNSIIFINNIQYHYGEHADISWNDNNYIIYFDLRGNTAPDRWIPLKNTKLLELIK